MKTGDAGTAAAGGLAASGVGWMPRPSAGLATPPDKLPKGWTVQRKPSGALPAPVAAASDVHWVHGAGANVTLHKARKTAVRDQRTQRTQRLPPEACASPATQLLTRRGRTTDVHSDASPLGLKCCTIWQAPRCSRG